MAFPRINVLRKNMVKFGVRAGIGTTGVKCEDGKFTPRGDAYGHCCGIGLAILGLATDCETDHDEYEFAARHFGVSDDFINGYVFAFDNHQYAGSFAGGSDSVRGARLGRRHAKALLS